MLQDDVKVVVGAPGRSRWTSFWTASCRTKKRRSAASSRKGMRLGKEVLEEWRMGCWTRKLAVNCEDADGGSCEGRSAAAAKQAALTWLAVAGKPGGGRRVTVGRDGIGSTRTP